MLEQGNTFCKIQHHSTQTIRFLCLEDGCQKDRLICPFCVRDNHRKHRLANLEKYIDPLGLLAMNSQAQQKEKCCQIIQNAVISISQFWQKITGLVDRKYKFLETSILHKLDTLSQTFSDNLLEQASFNMSSGLATPDEVEEYVKMINFLSCTNFNNPVKLMQAVQTIQRNMNQLLEDLYRKLNMDFTYFQSQVKKNSLQNLQVFDIEESTKIRNLPFIEMKSKENDKILFDQMKQSLQSFIKDQPSFLSEQKEHSEEPILKTEADDSSSHQMQIHINLENQDGINEMKIETKLKIRRVVVFCCKNPQSQLSKILSLSNLEELEIYWFQLAKKEYLIKIINHLQNLRILVLNCANQFDEECCHLVPKKLQKIRKLQYGWDFYNSLREYDDNIYFRLSPYTNRGCPLKTSITREMAVGLKRLETIWLGDFMYFRPSNNEIPFRKIKEFTLGQTKGRYFRIPEKLCVQLKAMKELLCLSILHVHIEERKLFPILLNNPFIKIFVVEGCEDITDESLKILAKNCNLTHLSIRENKLIEGSPIWEMTNLTTLILVECSRIKPSEILMGIGKMRYLTYLNLYGNKWVDDDLIRQIPNPENFSSINLGRTSITDEALTYLARMKQLKVLCLDCNKVGGSAIAILSKQIKLLEKISLWGLDGSLGADQITGDNLESLAKELQSLNHLSIRYCKQINGQIFLKFKSLRFLETDRSNLNREIETQLERKGVKLLKNFDKEVVEDSL